MNNMLVSGKNSRKRTTSQHVQTGTMKYEIGHVKTGSGTVNKERWNHENAAAAVTM